MVLIDYANLVIVVSLINCIGSADVLSRRVAKKIPTAFGTTTSVKLRSYEHDINHMP